jgi:hypothetical protein
MTAPATETIKQHSCLFSVLFSTVTFSLWYREKKVSVACSQITSILASYVPGKHNYNYLNNLIKKMSRVVRCKFLKLFITKTETYAAYSSE